MNMNHIIKIPTSMSILVPGSFIVLQGMYGDGVRNTIDQLHYHHNKNMNENEWMKYCRSLELSEYNNRTQQMKEQADQQRRNKSMNIDNNCILHHHTLWLVNDMGELLIFNQLPTSTSTSTTTSTSNNDDNSNSNDGVVGTLLPGMTIIGTELITVDSNDMNKILFRTSATTSTTSSSTPPIMNNNNNNSNSNNSINSINSINDNANNKNKNKNKTETENNNKINNDNTTNNNNYNFNNNMMSNIIVANNKSIIYLNHDSNSDNNNYHNNSCDDEDENIYPLNNETITTLFPHGKVGWTQFLKIQYNESNDNANNNNNNNNNEYYYVVYSINGYHFLGAGLIEDYIYVPKKQQQNTNNNDTINNNNNNNSSSNIIDYDNGYYYRVITSINGGAYIRDGLDLSSTYIGMIPYGTIVSMKYKVINAMGLSRYYINPIYVAIPYYEQKSLSSSQQQQIDNDTTKANHRPLSIATITRTNNNNITSSDDCNNDNNDSDKNNTIQYYRMVLIEGWCSEYLNPLSGQSGKIVQSIPYPIPIIYQINNSHSGGAIIRTDLELTSSSIIHTNMTKSISLSNKSNNNVTTTTNANNNINDEVLPIGTKLIVTGRYYAENPVDRCIERYRVIQVYNDNHNLKKKTSNNNTNNISSNSEYTKLLYCGIGYASVRLNLQVPYNTLVCSYYNIDDTYDPLYPTIYYIKQRQLLYQYYEYLNQSYQIQYGIQHICQMQQQSQQQLQEQSDQEQPIPSLSSYNRIQNIFTTNDWIWKQQREAKCDDIVTNHVHDQIEHRDNKNNIHRNLTTVTTTTTTTTTDDDINTIIKPDTAMNHDDIHYIRNIDSDDENDTNYDNNNHYHIRDDNDNNDEEDEQIMLSSSLMQLLPSQLMMMSPTASTTSTSLLYYHRHPVALSNEMVYDETLCTTSTTPTTTTIQQDPYDQIHDQEQNNPNNDNNNNNFNNCDDNHNDEDVDIIHNTRQESSISSSSNHHDIEYDCDNNNIDCHQPSLSMTNTAGRRTITNTILPFHNQINSPFYLPRRDHHHHHDNNTTTNNDVQTPQLCLLCSSSERDATIVHGNTGHIVCCLLCARILQAKNETCPVCRHPIQYVIQHFYA